MADTNEILEIEKERQEPSSWNIIHLFKQGSFYRAYEWSAWLVSVISFNDEVRIETEDRKPLTVTRKENKKEENSTFVFVGFPLTSISKYIPNTDDFTSVNDSQIDIAIDLPLEFEEKSYEQISQEIEEWKEGIAIKKEEKKKKSSSQLPPFLANDKPMSITSVMAQILAYPLEQKSPFEVVSFVSEIRRQLAQLF